MILLFANAPDGIMVSELDSLRVLSVSFSANDELPIEVTLSGNVSETSSAFWKAPSPIAVKPSGSSSEAIGEFINAQSPIEIKPSCRVSEVRAEPSQA